MNREKARSARVFGYVCFGLSLVNLGIYIAKSLFSDNDPSPALLIIGATLLIAGVIGLARAKKESQE